MSSYVTAKPKRRLFGTALICVLMPLILFANKPIPLQVTSKNPNLSGLQDAVKGGFIDIIQAQFTNQTPEYMEFVLTANGFITNQEHLCGVWFYPDQNGVRMLAVPFDVVNGERVEVLDFGVRKGVFLIVEGAAQEMDYEVEAGGMGGLGGF